MKDAFSTAALNDGLPSSSGNTANAEKELGTHFKGGKFHVINSFAPTHTCCPFLVQRPPLALPLYINHRLHHQSKHTALAILLA